MPAGRRPLRSELVERTEGTAKAKQRLRQIIETLGGERSVDSACEELGMSPAMFYKLRARFLKEAVAGLEQRTPGVKPRHTQEAAAEIDELRRRVEELEDELARSHLREEIALVTTRTTLRAVENEAAKKGAQDGR